MLRTLPYLVVALLAALTGGSAVADEKTDAPAPVALGETLAAFTATDFNGVAFDSSDIAITKERVEAALRKAIVAFGGAKDAPLTGKVDELSGLMEDGELSPRLRRFFVAEAGQSFGLQVTEERAATFETFQAVADWILGARSAPILLYAWSSRCPTSRSLTPRILSTLCETGVRAYAVACNYNEARDHVEGFIDEFDFRTRILMDTEQRLCDRLGAQRTPQFYLFDSTWTLRYRGGLDDDPAEMKADAERVHWLRDAAVAIKDGKPVPAADTEPAG